MASKNAMRVELYMGKLAKDVFGILESGKLGVENEIHINICGATERILWAEFLPETNTDKTQITISNYLVQGVFENGEEVVWKNLVNMQANGDAKPPPETAVEDLGGKGE